MSNFSVTPFEIKGKGYFKTVEGFWYWTLTGRDELRNMMGWQAKQQGSLYRCFRTHPTTNELKEAYSAKLLAHPHIKDMLSANNLPLKHYYVYNAKVIEPKEWLWTAELWNDLKD